MDTTILAIVIAILAVALASLLWYRSRQTGQTRRRAPPAPVDRGQDVPVGARARRGGARMRRPQQEAAGAAAIPEDEDEEDDQRREELEEAGIKVPEGKIGKKKMEKLQMKADKKLAREADERSREEAKKKKAEQEELEAKQRAQEEAEEKARLEQEQKEREEKERREHEEYLKLKAAFEVEEEGYDEDAQDDESDKLKKFIDYIKETKVVLLEDLAAHFKMKTQETIDRVTQMQEDGLLTGVIDDRGKFIYISPEELEAVAKFIRQRGRVSISELAECSNKLINLTSPEVTSA